MRLGNTIVGGDTAMDFAEERGLRRGRNAVGISIFFYDIPRRDGAPDAFAGPLDGIVEVGREANRSPARVQKGCNSPMVRSKFARAAIVKPLQKLIERLARQSVLEFSK